MFKQIIEQLAFPSWLFMDEFDLQLTTGYRGELATAKKRSWVKSFPASAFVTKIRDWVYELIDEAMMRIGKARQVFANLNYKLKRARIARRQVLRVPVTKRTKAQKHALTMFHCWRASQRKARREVKRAMAAAEPLRQYRQP